MTEIEILKDALRNVIINRDRVIRKIVDYYTTPLVLPMKCIGQKKLRDGPIHCHDFVRTINAKAIQR